MMKKFEIELEEHAENVLPRLFNWSARYPTSSPDGAVAQLLASISPRLGTKAHERVTPPATTAVIPLGRAEILSLFVALEEAIQVLQLTKPGTAH